MQPTPLEPGENLLHYRILEKIGAGGMGVVWKALDTKLHREVALKLLPSNQIGDPVSQQRFVREAMCASALNHPNIVTIHDIQCEPDSYFIVMEYVRGASIRQILDKGRLSVPEVLAYAVQVSDALAKAHSARIVHRDLKPANIMVTDEGRVKVLDFGLAKLPGADAYTSDSGSDAPTVTGSLSIPGVVLGTLAYMSPEQSLGDEVDQRSDVFSFGVVLYEMIAGVSPFRAGTNLELMRNILHSEPVPLNTLVPECPAGLDRVVRKCLEKDREKRYANTADISADLRDALAGAPAPAASEPVTAAHSTASYVGRAPDIRRRRFIAALVLLAALALAVVFVPWRTPPAAPQQRGVAVLPFTIVSANERTQAFGLGLVMALSTHLSGLESFQKAFWVVPASDVLQARAASARDARQLFGVDLVLTGSVETAAEKVRIAASLSDARTQRQLRSRQITVATGDSFALQDELMKVVTELLELELPVDARASIRSGSSSEPSAEDYYLQGRGYLHGGAEQADSAIVVFEEALKRDSQFARAHAALGEAYLHKYATTKDPQWIEKARASGDRALRLRGRTPETLIALGMIANAEGRYEEAAAQFQEAIRTEPRNRNAWMRLAQAFESGQRIQDAENALRKAVAIQPGYPGGHQSLATFYYRLGRYKESERSFQRVTELAPANFRAYHQLGALYLQLGRYREAEAELKRSLALKPSAVAYNNLSSCYFYQERYAEAVPMMERALELGQVSAKLLGNLARVYRLTPGLSSKAPPVYHRALGLARTQLGINPRDAETHADLALLLAETGDIPGAAREIEVARQLAPSSGAVLFYSVLVYEIIRDRERALLAYRSLAKSGSLLEEIRRSPELKSFRADSRYKEIK